jgi:hypothetical protein
VGYGPKGTEQIMSAMQRFRAGQAAGAQRAAAAPQGAPRRGRFAGTKASDARYPIAAVGQYTLRIIETRQTENPKTGEWYHVDFEVLDTSVPDVHPVGSKVTYLQGFSGKSMTVGMPKIKRFCMCAVGTDDEAEYDTMDPNGDLIDVTTGVAIEGYPANPLAGRIVYCDVTPGKPGKDGRVFDEFNFSVVPEDQQDVKLDSGAEAPAGQ